MQNQLNKEVCLWAAKRSNINKDEIVKKFPKFDQWFEGTHSPTINQMKRFAALTHVSLSDLFSDQMPDFNLQIADFRTVDDVSTVEPSPELYDTISLMKRRQEWMKDYFSHEKYEDVNFVGSFAALEMDKENISSLSSKLHSLLKLENDWATKFKTVDEAFKFLKDKIESLGIAVIVNGVVKDNTSRPLNVSEFRGFVLADKKAPLIFINGRDAKTAQIFTLVHELAHLAYAQTGVSNPNDEEESDSNSIEKFCNGVAAEFLGPADLILKYWNESNTNIYNKTKIIAQHLKVNFIVVARRILDLDLVNRESFFELYKKYKSTLSPIKKTNSGGNYYRTKQYRLGNVFSDAIWSAVNSGFISYRDAADLTCMNINSFNKFFEKVS